MENTVATQAPVPATQKDTISSLFNQDAVKLRFEQVLGKKAAGFMSSVISAVNANSELKKAAPMTVVSAAAIAASLDLPINPSLGFAHIVPYSGNAQFQMGYKGFIQLGMRSGQYKTINASPVYEGELIESNRFTGEMKFDESKKTSDKVIGYVAYFRLLNGFEKYLYMTFDQVTAHGKRYSKSYSSAKGKWQTDFDAMALKTVIKLLLSKYGILSIEMQSAVKYDQAVVHTIDGECEYADGNGDILDAEIAVEYVTEDQVKEMQAVMEEKKVEEQFLLNVMEADSLNHIKKENFPKAMQMLNMAIKRK